MVPSASIAAFDPRPAVLNAAQLPPTPLVLGRLLNAISDGDASLQFIGGLVRMEPVLAANLLRVANSALFGFRVPAGKVEEAILRVGMKEAHRIVALGTAARLFGIDLRLYGTTTDALWENAVVTAIAMEFLAEHTGNDAGLAYTSGLLRSVGKLVLARHACTLGTPPFVDGTVPLPTWERMHFGLTHAAVGAALCDQWRFPRAIGLALRDHLAPSGNTPALVLAHLLNAAGAVAEAVGRGLPGEKGLWAGGPERTAVTGVSESTLREIADRTLWAFDQMKDTLALIRS